jgi:hypothetical protein
MSQAYLVVRIDKATGQTREALVLSEWPSSMRGDAPCELALVTQASGSTFESARRRVLRHASQMHPWVLRFVTAQPEPTVLNVHGRPANGPQRVVVGVPRVVLGAR